MDSRRDRRRDWRDEGACLGLDPEVFFPTGASGFPHLEIERAKEVCAGCRVVQECLEWALASGQAAGVWGGTTEVERRTMRRARAG